MADGIEFGLFDWIDFSDPARLGAAFQQRLKLLEYADAAGYYSYHLAEHHLTPLSGVPSPGIFLAAASQRTTRIRLGALVFLLPLYHPVRLAQEICMLDHLSGGRIDLGTGRGISPHELRLLGADFNDSRGQHDEAFRILLELLSTGKLAGFRGKHYNFDALDIILRTVQKPYPPLWYPVIDPERAAWAGSEGINTVTLLPANDYCRSVVDVYAEAWQANRGSPSRLNAHVAAPKFGLMRQVYIAETHDKAFEEAKAAFDKHAWAFLYLWDVFGEAQEHAYLKDWDAQIAGGGVLVGTASEIREQVEQQLDLTGANYFVANFTFGDLTDEQVMRSATAFTQEVMPRIGPASRAFAPS
ncbi:MAG TPA: LLM class flavin-dependent oxidoreductase [Dehalococcoidia bacterium]|nr:LLM class flavin-dependent oxidoreductase [Dehalococcoidia bacterium]